MKKYTLLVLFFALLTSGVSAQLVNSGGTITIQSGAKLVVESDISNNTGSIVNNGTIEVEGDFTNSATVTSDPASKLVFTGAANSNFDSGASTFAIVENDKTAGHVVLTNNVAITEAVDFSEGTSNFILGAYDVNLAEATTTNGSQATGYFVTDGTGVVSKTVTAAGSTTFDVGDAVSYTPITAAHTGTYGAAAAVTAKVTPADHPNKPAEADAFISRYWNVEHVDITSPSTALEGTYAMTDVTGTQANVVGAIYEDGEWNYGTGTGLTVSATAEEATTSLTGTNFFGKADLKFYLQAAYDTGGNMLNSINSVIPLTSPYTDAPATATAIPANAVDWIKIETRDATTSSIVVGKSSAFLLTDGSVVSVDGTSLPVIKDLSQGYIAIYHRNHLPVRTSSTLDFSNATEYNMSLLANVYNDSGVPNAAMIELETGVYGLFGGDSNGDGYIRYTDGFIPPFTFLDSDATEIFSDLGNVPNGQIAGYEQSDINMDGYVRYTDGFVPPFTFIDSDATEIFSILGNVSSNQIQKNLD